MALDVFYILDPGYGAQLQDKGRIGWRRFGVPAGGVMDSHASSLANQLLGNPADAPVLELMLQGAKLAVLRSVWVAVTGADSSCNIPVWRSVHLQVDDVIAFPRNVTGVWSYLAVEGGFDDERTLGSLGVCPRARLGRTLSRGSILRRSEARSFELPKGVAGRTAPISERRNYLQPPKLRVWPGPQWELFHPSARLAFLNQLWSISSKCDRTGYRLEGVPIKSTPAQLISEPVRVGTVQIPENGLPIVTLNDGPTVGGYPKIAYIDPPDLSWLTQARAGQGVRFELAK